MANQAKRTFVMGEIVPENEAEEILGKGRGGGWFRDVNGREVYMCDGSHKDGTRGFKIKDFDGLR